MRYGIDINENAVRVIKYATNGLIRKLGECDFYSPHPMSSAEYVADLAESIKYAARDAGMGRGSSCSVVAGGPEVIIRKFTWPELPDTALAENAQSEFAPFLPGNVNEFVMSYEVIKRGKSEESDAITMDVLVAALPKELVDAINKAVSKAGFRVQRIDVRENARMKLVSNCCIAQDNPAPTSYAVLDFSQARANVGLYLDGTFYSSRYFVATIFDEEEPEQEPIQEYDEYGEPIPMEEPPPKRPQVGKYDPGVLANEVVSIIDYMQYRERGSSISCILLIGEENLPGIIESLEDSLDIPVFRTMDWLYSGIDSYVTGTYGEFILAPYLDAYATSFPSLNPKKPINIKGSVEVGKNKKLIVPFAVAGVGVVALMVAAVLYFTPRIRDLEAEIAQVQAAAAQFDTADHAELTQATRQADLTREQINTVNKFFTEHFQMHQALPIFLDPTVDGNLGRNPLWIMSFDFSSGEGSFRGNGNSFIHVADATDYMIANELVYSASVTTVRDTPHSEDGIFKGVPFVMDIVMEEGVGIRHGFIND